MNRCQSECKYKRGLHTSFCQSSVLLVELSSYLRCHRKGRRELGCRIYIGRPRSAMELSSTTCPRPSGYARKRGYGARRKTGHDLVTASTVFQNFAVLRIAK